MKEILSNGLTRKEGIEAVRHGYVQEIGDFTDKCNKYWLDIPYDTQSDRQKIDIYLPEGEGPFPVLLEVHGGGWFTGDRKDFGLRFDMELLPYGYGVVSVGYRLDDEAAMPGPLEDVEAAIRFVQAHGKEYNLDTSRMCGTASSAGTTLLMAAALKIGGFKAIMTGANILDFTTITAEMEQLNYTRVKAYDFPEHDYSMEGLLLGGSLEECPEMWKLLDAKNYIDENAPHMLLMHGVLDKVTPYLQSVHFADAVNEKSGDPERAKYMIVAETGHSGKRYNEKECFLAALRFIETYLK